MKHIIFGGDGFLGTDLTRRLVERGEKVLILDQNKSEENENYSHNLVDHIILDVTGKDEFNLGSENPPTVRELLSSLIEYVGSHSILLPTPAFAVKGTLALLDRLGIPLMDPEQYAIADETCVLDCKKAKRLLGWAAKDTDKAMLIAAYDDYKRL